MVKWFLDIRMIEGKVSTREKKPNIFEKLLDNTLFLW